MAAETRSGNLWESGQLVDDGSGPWEWVRANRIYCAAVAAIVVATLFGADWAGQPSGEVGTTSSSPSVTLEVPSPEG